MKKGKRQRTKARAGIKAGHGRSCGGEGEGEQVAEGRGQAAAACSPRYRMEDGMMNGKAIVGKSRCRQVIEGQQEWGHDSVTIPCRRCLEEDIDGRIATLEAERQMLVETCLQLARERDSLRTDLKALAEAIDTCLARRGAYSCSPTHDFRCDNDRGIGDECVCGADDLTAALARPGVRAILWAPCSTA